jgi:hypothetical protein
MSVTRIALVAIVVALVAAEIVRPTTFHAKRLGHATIAATGAHAKLDQAELDDLPPSLRPALGSIDRVLVVTPNGAHAFHAGESISKSTTLRVAGWCADPQSRAPGLALLSIVDRRRRMDVTEDYRILRPDVAKFYSAPAMQATGFGVEIAASTLGVGDHTMSIAVVTSDGGSVATFPVPLRFSVR